MFAVIFHVRLLISPLCSLIILSKHLNIVHDAAVKKGKLFAIRPLMGSKRRPCEIIWSEEFSFWHTNPSISKRRGPQKKRKKKKAWMLVPLLKSERALLERHSRRLKVKRAKELELVVVDKRAKRKESRVLDSNGESGALGGLYVLWEGEVGWGGVGFSDEF